MPKPEFYISVDVETAGPNPGRYAMLSIGACTVAEPGSTFYVEMQPDRDASLPDALAVSGLKLDELARDGKTPKEAMQAFADWVAQVTPPDHWPVFVAFNAPFDWMFVADYFHRYLGDNPFGHSALDVKAFYMGTRGVPWGETGFDKVTEYYKIKHPLTHNALQDACDQARVFRKMLAESKGNQENI
jgi:DNA polymerase III epsilon subunit-like protein